MTAKGVRRESSLPRPRSEWAGRPAGVVDEPMHRGGTADAKRAVRRPLLSGSHDPARSVDRTV